LKLISFRVKKYKRIDDTGVIKIENLVAFVGRNESGKSSILTALAKLNSSNNLKFNKLHDIPHKEYGDLTKITFYPIMAQFELEENDELFKNLPKTFVVGRNYDNKFAFGKDYESFPQDLLPQEAETEEAETEEAETEEAETEEAETEEAETEEAETEEENIIDLIKLEKKLPRFIYVEDYDRLQGTFDVPEFLEDSKKDSKKEEMRLKRCIFDYVGLEPEDFADLLEKEDPENPDKKVKMTMEEKDEKISVRKFKTDNASEKMTEEFNKRWLNNQYYKFQYRPDGRMLKVWISDEYDDTGVDIQLRSRGFQYFFAFFLIYKIENDRYDKNTILLLDEPGLHFHGTLQLKLIDFFEELSKEHQVLYSTHSPFLVDKENLTKIVYIDKITGKTKIVAEGAISLDEDSIFPLKVNWYTSQYQKYVRDKSHILLEGPLDEMAFNKINTLFENKKTDCYIDSAIFVAAEGDKISQVVSILKTNKLNMVYFLDGDKEGLINEKRCKNLNLKGHTTKKYLPEKHYSMLEDLFPYQKYVDVAFDVYEIESKNKSTFNYKKDLPITHQIKEFLESHEINTKGYKARIMTQLLKNIEKDDIKEFETVFADLKKILESQNEYFQAEAWNDGEKFSSGEGYGIQIKSNENKVLHFDEEWSNVLLRFENQKEEIQVEVMKLDSGLVLSSKEIGKWLIENGKSEWGLSPPKIKVYPLGNRTFKIYL